MHVGPVVFILLLIVALALGSWMALRPAAWIAWMRRSRPASDQSAGGGAIAAIRVLGVVVVVIGVVAGTFFALSHPFA